MKELSQSCHPEEKSEEGGDAGGDYLVIKDWQDCKDRTKEDGDYFLTYSDCQNCELRQTRWGATGKVCRHDPDSGKGYKKCKIDKKADG